MTEYYLVEWPECQYFSEHPQFEECYWACDGMFLFVPKELYNKVRLNVDNSEFEYGHNVVYGND